MGKDAAWPSSPTEDIPSLSILSYLQGLESTELSSRLSFLVTIEVSFTSHQPFPFLKLGLLTMNMVMTAG